MLDKIYDDRTLLLTYDVFDKDENKIVQRNIITQQSDIARFLDESISARSKEHYWNNLRVDYIEGIEPEALEAIKWLRNLKYEVERAEERLLSGEETSAEGTVDNLLKIFLKTSAKSLGRLGYMSHDDPCESDLIDK